MTPAVILGVVIAIASIWGAAYLMSLWHEDRDDMRLNGQVVGWRAWPVSRVIAYLAVGATIASNVLAGVTALRLVSFPSYREIQLALSPLTLTALIYLDLVFVVLAAYLRVVRARSGKRPL